MAEVTSITTGGRAPSDPDALRHEIDVVREDMAESIRRLRHALSPRVEAQRVLRSRPKAVAAVAALAGAIVLLAVRHIVRRRREQHALGLLLEARTGWWPRLPRSR